MTRQTLKWCIPVAGRLASRLRYAPCRLLLKAWARVAAAALLGLLRLNRWISDLVSSGVARLFTCWFLMTHWPRQAESRVPLHGAPASRPSPHLTMTLLQTLVSHCGGA